MIDTHCHIDLYPDPHAVVKEVEMQQILTIAVTNLPSHFEIGQPHIRGFQYIRHALGLHPLMAEQHERERANFSRMFSSTSYIGEVGLDFSKAGQNHKHIQIDSLRFVFNLIQDRPRFVSLHSRGAESMVLELLEEFNIQRAVFHWYSGSLTVLDKVVQAGHYFSVNTAMTRSKTGRIIINRIPLEQILTESDGPHIKIRNRPIKPTDIKNVLETLGGIFKLSVEATKAQIMSNFMNVITPIREQISQKS